MTKIIPRWEWRTFDPDLGDAERQLAALEPELVEESDETYLVSPGSDASVKVRGGLMDVKVLEHVSEAGLQQWRPVMKAEFPLSCDDAEQLFAALGVAPLASGNESLSFEQLEVELAAERRGVLPVAVHKRRLHYTVGGCMAEMADVTADGKTGRTIAVESTDAAAVEAAVREIGLAGRVNTSYPAWLKAAFGVGG